jgi:hypothetical protein
MATPITGTTAWTFDSSQAGSFIGGTGHDSDTRVGRGAKNAAETLYYFPDRNAQQKIFRLDLTGANAGKATTLYATTGVTATQIRVLLSADEQTIYLVTNSGGTYTVYNVAADGSTPTPFSSAATFSGPSGATKFHQSPHENRAFQTTGSADGIMYTVPGTWANSVNLWVPPGPMLLDSTGFQAGYADRILWGTDANFFSGLHCYIPSQGRSVCLVGSQAGGAGGTGANPWAVATGSVSDCCADADFAFDNATGVVTAGSAYFTDAANTVRRLDATGVNTVIASAYQETSGLVHLPATNALLVCSDQTVRKVT